MPIRQRTAPRDIAQEITDKLIARLEESGPLPWRRPWRSSAMAMPLRHTGEAYKGVNHLLLAIEAHCSGYTTPYWMTFRQAKELGGCVCKGERSSMVVYYGTALKKDSGGEAANPSDNDEAGMYRFLKGYAVFNASQIDGLPEKFHPESDKIDTGLRMDARLGGFFDRMPFSIQHGYEYAAYREMSDKILMPDISRFESESTYFATLCHEATHASGIPARLNRECFTRYHADNQARAAEELVAEIGAMMLTARLDVSGEHIDNHAAYVASWLRALRSDKRHIFKAAAEAQRACDWLLDQAGIRDIAPATLKAA